MRSALGQFWAAKDGHTAIEYGMIAALIVLLLIAALGSMGVSVENMMTPLEKAIAAPKA